MIAGGRGRGGLVVWVVVQLKSDYFYCPHLFLVLLYVSQPVLHQYNSSRSSFDASRHRYYCCRRRHHLHRLNKIAVIISTAIL